MEKETKTTETIETVDRMRNLLTRLRDNRKKQQGNTHISDVGAISIQDIISRIKENAKKSKAENSETVAE